MRTHAFYLVALLIGVGCLTMRAHAADAKPDTSVDPGWTLGRATYYAAPEFVSRAYDPSRSEGSFGILAYGACGYTNLPKGDLPFPREQYAAAADANSDYPGSCGRCYEIRCKPGFVLGNSLQPIKLVYPGSSKVAYFDGDYARPYLASINASVPDEQGRRYPGNPTESQGLLSTQCYDPKRSLRVRIADQCPCKQVLPAGAPGVKPGGETKRQEWCCGPVPHFDISYWAFEQLSHPVSGAMMLEYRPVDCDTGAVIASNFISPVIYSAEGGIKPGWGWYPYMSAYASLLNKGAGPNGGYATCVELARSPFKGSLSFRAREASRQGFQPFRGKSKLEFAIRSNSDSSDPSKTSTPKGQVPGLKVFLMQDFDKYCGSELILGKTTQPQRQEGGWAFFSVPLSDFKCEPGKSSATLDALDRIDFENIAERDAEVCLSEIKLV